jgi:hypothetical protein
METMTAYRTALATGNPWIGLFYGMLAAGC